jgi:hypothetical protein
MTELEIIIAAIILGLVYQGAKVGWKIGRKFVNFVDKP